MGSWDGLNRRKFPRIKYPCMIILKQDQEKTDIFLTHTENVGIGGVCLILKKKLKLFTPVEMELDLLDMEQNIKCPGKIVWSIRRKMDEEKKPLYYDLGVEFVSLQQKDQKRLEEILKRLGKNKENIAL